MKRVIVLMSGGLDSTVLAYELQAGGYEVQGLGVHYGQRHVKELVTAQLVAARLHTSYDVVDLSTLKPFLTASALTGTDPVPHGHYAEESMKVTVVPNRNMIMLAVAAGVAASRGAQAIATAVHAGDHFIYPDCRPAFIDAMRNALCKGMDGLWQVELLTPFLVSTKADIVKRGAALGVPFDLTWSCYEGVDLHCGRCGTCVERREAFELAGVKDPTRYAVGAGVGA